ncbi:transposase [Crocinitomix catalasitica]|nr:transposase [Crocinitomix catalasitica]MBN4077652.1 transposase [bacterium AH-315-C20]
MKASIKLIRKKRHFSEEFKKRIVREYESGKFSVPQLERIHGISNSLIYRWIYKYSTVNSKGYRVIEMKESSLKKVKDLEQQVKELERVVGQKQIQIDYLEKMMELAKDELDIDIKKNFDTPRSTGSEKTKRS